VAALGKEVVVAFTLLARGAKPFEGREDLLLFTERAGRWGTPVVVAHSVGENELQLGVDGLGERILAWGGDAVNHSWVETQIVRRDGTRVGPPQIAGGGFTEDLSLAVNKRGDAVLAWCQKLNDGEGRGPVEATTRPAGGRFPKKHVVLAKKSNGPLVSIRADGTATVLFSPVAPSHGEQRVTGVEAATHTARDGWAKPVPVAGGVVLVALSSSPDGELFGLWEGAVPGPLFAGKPRLVGVIDSSIQPAGGSWQPPVTISPPGAHEYRAALGVAANGHVTALWLLNPGRQINETFESSDYVPGV
jgi:hypothetical protein